MKTLTLETCKRLQEAGIEIKTEAVWYLWTDGFRLGENNKKIQYEREDAGYKDEIYPAPNLEEAIELLPNGIGIKYNIYYRSYIGGSFYNTDSLQVIEQMINYLLDNNLLGTQK